MECNAVREVTPDENEERKLKRRKGRICGWCGRRVLQVCRTAEDSAVCEEPTFEPFVKPTTPSDAAHP